MKLRPFISLFKSKDHSIFPQFNEQSECAEDLSNFTEYIVRIILTQEVIESHFSDFAGEEDCILAFIDLFSRTRQNILKIPSDYK